MLVFTKGLTTSLNVTLNDSVTLSNPYYLFVFENVSDKTIVNLIVNSVDDTSDYPERVNKFDFDISIFSSAVAGQYVYNVYEQVSSTNTNIAGLNLIENGRMVLNNSDATINYLTGYSPQTKYV